MTARPISFRAPPPSTYRRAVTPPDAAGGPAPPPGPAGSRAHAALVAAVLSAAADGPLDDRLREIARAAADQVGAVSGAVGVLGPDGQLDRLVTVGMDQADAQRAGRLLSEPGALDRLPDEPGILRVPIQVRGLLLGHLLLGPKGRDAESADADAVQALAALAGLAVENSRLAVRAELRRVWVQAGTEVATALLSGAEPTAVFGSIAERVADLAGADLVGVLRPTPDDDEALTVVAAAGEGGADLEGVRVPLATTHVGRVHRSGIATLVPDSGVDPAAAGHAEMAVEVTRDLGPGLMVPMVPVRGAAPLGMLVALRRRGREEFDPALLEPMTAFTARAAWALTLVHTRESEHRLQLQADRDRIARDLHDHVVQRIFATALSLDRQSRSLEAEQPELAERLARSVDELDGTIAEIRATIFELQQEDQHRAASLRARLADVVRQVTEGRQLRRDVRARGAVDDLPVELVPDLLAVVRELVTNVVRHASASRVTVTLTVDDEVRLVVTDDGIGLPPSAVRSGLANLASRAERRGGRLTAVPRAGGTQVRWSIPRP
jgi:signal transduction histidine kinase